VDSGNNRVQEWGSLGTEFVTQFGGKGSGAGQLSSPEGVEVDSTCRIWVTDTGNNRVQRWGP